MIFSRMKMTYKVKQKTFFLVWQVLSFKCKKQTSKNVADTTFKNITHALHQQKHPCKAEQNVYMWKKCPTKWDPGFMKVGSL